MSIIIDLVITLGSLAMNYVHVWSTLLSVRNFASAGECHSVTVSLSNRCVKVPLSNRCVTMPLSNSHVIVSLSSTVNYTHSIFAVMRTLTDYDVNFLGL